MPIARAKYQINPNFVNADYGHFLPKVDSHPMRIAQITNLLVELSSKFSLSFL